MVMSRTKIGTCIICNEELKIHKFGKYLGKCYACAKFMKGYDKRIKGIDWGEQWNREEMTQEELVRLVPSLQRGYGGLR